MITLPEQAPASAELQMRESTVPTPKSTDELVDYIAGLIGMQHDYGTCVYAMSMAAVAAFNFVANDLGVTGFQASCADLDIIRRVRRLEGPFMLVDASKAMYPQHDLIGDVQKFLESTKPWLATEAHKRLIENPETQDPDFVHPDVRAHWKALARPEAA